MFWFALQLASILAACNLATSSWNGSCTVIQNNGYFIPGCSANRVLVCNCSGGYYGTLTSSFLAGANISALVISAPGNITSIASGAFSGFSALQCVGITNNQISTVSAGVFSVPTLNIVSLKSNKIMSVAAGAFTGLPVLSLELSDNLLTSLSFKDVFANLTLLQIDLSFNLITSLEIVDFPIQDLTLGGASFTSLTVQNSSIVHLTLNNLTSVGASSLGNLSGLQYLAFYYVDRVEPGTLACCPDLQQLSFYNPYGAVGSGVVVNHPKLSTVSITAQAISPIVNTPRLVTVFVTVPFASSHALKDCQCSATLSGAVQCPFGTTSSFSKGGGCACLAGYVCSPFGPATCDAGTYSSDDFYVDQPNATCVSCPAGTTASQQSGCAFCSSNSQLINNSCVPCSASQACPPGALQPLSSAQVQALLYQPAVPEAIFVNTESQTSPGPKTISVIVVLSILALLGFLLPVAAAAFKFNSWILQYIDLMSLAHKVQIGKSLVRQVSWLGVSMSFAFICAAVIMAVVLINANSPVTEYGLKLRDGELNPGNQVVFTLTPWVNDPFCLQSVIFNRDASLIASAPEVTNGSNCSLVVSWAITTDTRLAFDVPVSAQSVQWATSARDLYRIQTNRSGFASPQLNFVFTSGAVTLDFSARDAYFVDADGTRTDGLQLLYLNLDRGEPVSVSAPVISSYWRLEVSFSVLDATFWGRTHNPQSNAQLFASILSVTTSLLGAAGVIFGRCLEPLVQYRTQQKSVAKFTNVEFKDRDAAIVELKESFLAKQNEVQHALLAKQNEVQQAFLAKIDEVNAKFGKP